MTPRSKSEWSEERRRLYAQLLDEQVDPDTLHQLLIAKGSELLDASVPYLVVAVRNQARSRARRDRRRSELEERTAAQSRPSLLDPADGISAREDLGAVLAQLGRLDASYSWPLWWHAGGFSDEDIVELWNDAGFKPRDPTLATIRKRRERARARLRTLLKGSTERQTDVDDRDEQGGGASKGR